MSPSSPVRLVLRGALILAAVLPHGRLGAAASGEPSPDALAPDQLPAFEAAVAEHLRFQAEAAIERNGIEEDRRAIARELDVLRRQREALNDSVRKARASVGRSDPRPTGTLNIDPDQTLREEVETASAQVQAAAELLRSWRTRLPPGLEDRLDETLRSVDQAADAAALAAAVAEGWARVRALSLQWHVTQARIDLPDGPRRLDILYAGLSRGFAIAPDGREAWYGRPGDGRWTWTACPARAADFLAARAQVARGGAPRLVVLPAGEAP